MRWIVIFVSSITACGGTSSTTSGPPTAPGDAEAPIESRALEGAYESLDSYCAQLERKNRRAVTVSRPVDDEGRVQDMTDRDREELDEAGLDCRLDYSYDEDADDEDADDEDAFFGFALPVEGPTEATGSGPLRQARILPFGEGDTECRIALRTDAGWFVQPRGVLCHAEDGSLRGRSEELAIQDVVGGDEAEVLWRFARTRRSPEGELVETRGLILCGIGESDTPSCYEPLVTGGRRHTSSGSATEGAAEIEGTALRAEFQLRVRFGRDHVTLVGEIDGNTVGAETAAEVRGQMGRHPVEFD